MLPNSLTKKSCSSWQNCQTSLFPQLTFNMEFCSSKQGKMRERTKQTLTLVRINFKYIGNPASAAEAPLESWVM